MAEDWSVDIPSTLEVGDPNGGFIFIGSPLPPELAAFYGFLPTIVNVIITVGAAPGTYFYIMEGLTGLGLEYTGIGHVFNNAGTITVHEYFNFEWGGGSTLPIIHINSLPTPGVGPNPLTTISGSIQLLAPIAATLTADALLAWTINGPVNLESTTTVDGPVTFNNTADFQGSTVTFHGGINLNFNGPNVLSMSSQSDLQFIGVSSPRTVIYEEQITTVAATPASSANAVTLWTSASQPTFKNGRAYDIELVTQLQSATVQSPTTTISEVSAPGNIPFNSLITGPRLTLPNSFGVQLIKRGAVVNTSGADITVYICLVVQPSANAVVNLQGMALPGPSFVRIMDIGAASSYPTTGVQLI